MRISDWSSDVCSSDLPFAAHRAVPAVMPVADHAGYGPAVAESHSGQRLHRVGMVLAAGEDKRAGAAEVGRLLEELGVVILDPLQMATQDQIGRASGRERVCQYV